MAICVLAFCKVWHRDVDKSILGGRLVAFFAAAFFFLCQTALHILTYLHNKNKQLKRHIQKQASTKNQDPVTSENEIDWTKE